MSKVERMRALRGDRNSPLVSHYHVQVLQEELTKEHDKLYKLQRELVGETSNAEVGPEEELFSYNEMQNVVEALATENDSLKDRVLSLSSKIEMIETGGKKNRGGI
jgi:hypothetical protein